MTHAAIAPHHATARLHIHHLAHALAFALFAGSTHAAVYSASSEAELIQVINNANGNAGADSINVTADITLTAALPVITNALTIQGSSGQRAIRRDDTGANACSPTAMNAFRLIDASADLTLQNLTLFGADPLLLPLAYNGGITPTHALLPTSPAIDQGTNAQSLVFDQRGTPYARVVGAAADIGAYEFDADRVFANGFE